MVGSRDRVGRGVSDEYISKAIGPDKFVASVEAFLRTDQRSGRTAPPVTRVPAVPAKAKHSTILAVDDDPVNLSLKRSMLEPLGYAVLTATAIPSPLQLAPPHPPHPL